MLTPNFQGELVDRMENLENILTLDNDWILIGSSLGGLMATLYAAKHPLKVKRLILLAPALTLPEFSDSSTEPIQIPTTIIHGTQDEILPLITVQNLAIKVFTNLTYIITKDNHRLHTTADVLDWKTLVAQGISPNH